MIMIVMIMIVMIMIVIMMMIIMVMMMMKVIVMMIMIVILYLSMDFAGMAHLIVQVMMKQTLSLPSDSYEGVDDYDSDYDEFDDDV